MSDAERSITRRNILRSAVAGGTAGTVTTGRATAQRDQPDARAELAAQAEPAQQNGGRVTVEMTDDLVFAPEEIRVLPGTTIVWENVGTVGHSVTAYEDRIPEEAEFFASGGFSAEEPARNGYPARGDVAGGESYEHTFEVEGSYRYFCIPHEQVGMLGTVVVSTQPAPTPEPLPGVPDELRLVGIAAGAAMLGVFSLALFFLKYGGDYPEE